MQKQKKSYLGLAILIALVLGIVAGIILQKQADFTTNYLKPIGTIYVNLLKMLVVPVVLFSIIDGVVSLGSVKKVGSIGWKTVVFFLFTTALAIVIGLCFAYAFKGTFPLLEAGDTTEVTVPEVPKFMDTFVNIFPSNFIQPLLDTAMLPTIVIALLLGIGILLTGEDGKRVGDNFRSFYVVVMKIMSIVLWLTPIGVFCLMANVVALNGAKILGALGFVLLATYIAYIVHVVVVYGLTLKIFARISPVAFIKKMFPAMTTAFTTTSSNATLPLTLEGTNALGCDNEVSSFVLPLGCTINMDGAAIYMGVASVFIAKCYGIDLSLTQLITIVLTATLASIGSAGVPGAAKIMLVMVLESVGIPVEGAIILWGIDNIFDMGRTCLNVTGDSVCALAVDRIEKNRRARKADK